MTRLLQLLFLFFYFGALSQSTISFRQLSVVDGLSQNSAVSVAQDVEGFLWIATQDGLNRYDGNDFKVFPLQFEDITKPNYSYLGKVYCFADSSVWALPSDRNLYRFDRATATFQKSDLDFSLSAFLVDNQATLWYGTHASGLFYQGSKDKAPKRFTLPDADDATLFDLKQSKSKKVVLAGSGIVGEVSSISQTFTSYLKEATSINYSSITEDNSGLLWIGSYGAGLWVKTPNQPHIQPFSAIFPKLSLPASLNVQAIYADSKNRLWVATYGDGLYLIAPDRKTLTHFKHQKRDSRTIHYDDVLSVFEDYSGTLWFGTDGGGLSYYDSFLEKFTPYLNAQTPENVSIDVVRAIAKDAANFLWIGTSGKGLTRYDLTQATWKTFTTTNLPGLQSNRIMSLFSHKSGDLWVGTQEGGLHIFDSNGRVSSLLQETGAGPHTIWQIFQDQKARLWLATRDMGLVLVDEKGRLLRSYDFATATETGSKLSIRTVREGGGYLWLGTDYNGLIRFHPETGRSRFYKSGPLEHSLSSNQIKSLYYEKDKNLLWIGTNGRGLDVLDVATQRFYNFSEKDGLANGVIYGILSDSNPNLWLSSNKGITKFYLPNGFDSKPNVVNFSNYDGLATEFNTGAYYQATNGELYFGSLEGFYAFKPEFIQSNTVVPKTKITKVDVFNAPLDISEAVRLSHKENTLTFYFAALQFSLPEKNQYKYRLLPLDEKWNSSGNIPFARYTNLPPGNYTFEVVGANYDGYWGTSSDTFHFTIAQPWYANTVSFVVYAFLFLLFLYWLYLYFMAQLNYKIKQDEAEQLKTINAYKTKLFSDLSHEIRTPLTLMAIPLQQQMTNPNLPIEVKNELVTVSKNKDRIITLVDQLHDLTQVELGTIALRVSEGDLYLMVSSLVHSFAYVAHEKQIALQSKLSIQERAWFSEDVLLKILTNLLSNAVKFCPSGGVILFEATLTSSKQLEVTVQNDIAKPIEKPDQLFDRFYREQKTIEGSGIGLSLAKELVELHKGTLVFYAKQKYKAVFKLTLPLAQEHYANDEIAPGKPVNESTSQPSVKPTASLLIVEDHEDLRAALVTLFQANYLLYEATNGLDALEIAKKELPDLVISDVMMPKMDGLALCQALKTSEFTSHIPVLLLTAKADEEAERTGISEGADAYIKKPFHVELLQLKVEKLIESRQLLREKYKHAVTFTPSELAVSTTEMKFMEKLQTVVDDHIKDCSFDITQFCDFMGMSRMQLHRKLKAVTGQSTGDFIKSNRLKIADALLLKTDLQIAEVAYLSGFNSASYFIKSFKEQFGVTPTERRG
ncbi:hybrid sensor histidine kinase/response regulator transcription factor [Flavobacterium orientale]|uniref:hybrid sensor histidine kinase/response regulator transcription factor n=1 Tax=Flavobacterium orientale TaxID=1756020 RepID=UPI0016658B4D|nr:two-component regulator propeller domain-containing protein [Flavobacterium orientale]